MKSLGITWYRECSCRLHGLATYCVSISFFCWISSITPHPHNYLVQFHCGSMHDNTENMPDSIFLFVKSLGFPTKLNYIGRGHTVLKHFRLNCSPRSLGVDSILNFDRSLFFWMGSVQARRMGMFLDVESSCKRRLSLPKKCSVGCPSTNISSKQKSRRNMRIQLQPQKTRTARSMMKKKTQAGALEPWDVRCKVVWDGFFWHSNSCQCAENLFKFVFIPHAEVPGPAASSYFFLWAKLRPSQKDEDGERERKQGSLAFTKMEVCCDSCECFEW